MTFEEWWQREYPYNQYERHFGGRAWQAAQAEQAAECERLKRELEATWDHVKGSESEARHWESELRKVERERDELRQQIAVKDKILTILRGVHAGLVDLLRSHSTMENAPPGFQDVALRSLAGEEALLAQIDAALNAETRQ